MSEVKLGENHPMFGKTHSAETKEKISLTLTKKVFLYSFDSETKVTILNKTFNSSIEAVKHLDISRRTLSRYLDKNKLYKKEWILTTSLITKG
jgi:group I intron endonuclease